MFSHGAFYLVCFLTFLLCEWGGGGGGGGGESSVIQTLRKGGSVSDKTFSALCASVWSKIKGGPVPPGPSPESATEYKYISIAHGFQLIVGSGRFLEGIQATSCYGDI